ncbi:GTP-binding protein [Citricoccus alkalitolerans]|uniref:GTP-binding protein n=1 Tax=Citricoccus alkalitolerans TaxID=246603 RepID=A0ABV8Y1J4_9MICC
MRLTVISSLDALCRHQACDMLAAAYPDAVLMLHDLLEDGLLVCRSIQAGTPPRWRETRLEHPCPSCAIRLDIVPAVQHARDAGVEHLILGLPPALPAAAVVRALSGGARRSVVLHAVVLACSPSAVEHQIWDRHTLFESGYLALPDDERTPGEFLMEELASIDTVLLADPNLVPADPPASARGLQLLRELAPHARITDLASDLDPLQEDVAASPSRAEPYESSSAGVASAPPFTTVIHQLHRPLHPERFHQALRSLAQGCCRLRGQLWMAPAPECRILLRGAGPRVWLENAGPWPVYLDSAAPGTSVAKDANVSFHAIADAGHPSTVISATGEDLDAVDIARLLTDCQLTEDEMKSGFTALADPFGLHTTHDIDSRRAS